jgi:hypothetical protein
MESIRFSMLFAFYVVLDARFSLYYYDNPQTSYVTFDCIYAHLYDDSQDQSKSFLRKYHLIPYCRRPDINKQQNQIGILNGEMGRIIRFDELNKQGVTSAHLLTWMALIDVAER